MPSRLLFDKRNKEILRCQPEPFGSAGLPSFEALCNSARVPLDEIQYMNTIVINEDILTREAKSNFYLSENDNGSIVLIEKPEALIVLENEIINISADNTATIRVYLDNLNSYIDYSYVTLNINGVEFNVKIDINTYEGLKYIKIEEAGEYIISGSDDRFNINEVMISAV